MRPIRHLRRLLFKRPKQRTRHIRRLMFPLNATQNTKGPPIMRINMNSLPALQTNEHNPNFYTRYVPRTLRSSNVIRTFRTRRTFLTELKLPLFLTVSNKRVNLRRIFYPRRANSMNTSTRPNNVKVNRRSRTIFLHRSFRRLLTFFIFMSTGTIYRRSRNVNRIKGTNNVMFTLCRRRPINIRRFSFTRHPLPTDTEQRDTTSDEIYASAN